MRLSTSLKTLVVALGLASATACNGGGTPTGPTPPIATPSPGQGSSVSVSALIGGQPLAGVTVSGGGQSAVTGADGAARFGQAIPAGAMLSFALGGFITREAPFRDGMSETLMLNVPDEAFLWLAFSGNTGFATKRVANGTRVCYVPEGALLDTAPLPFRQISALEVVRKGVANAATLPGLARAGVTLEVATSPQSGCLNARVVLNPSIPPAGWAVLSGNPITSILIEIRTVGLMEAQLVAHEVGHSLGFGHNPQWDALMCSPETGGCNFPVPDTPNQTERLVSEWLYARPPSTLFKDKAR